MVGDVCVALANDAMPVGSAAPTYAPCRRAVGVVVGGRVVVVVVVVGGGVVGRGGRRRRGRCGCRRRRGRCGGRRRRGRCGGGRGRGRWPEEGCRAIGLHQGIAQSGRVDDDAEGTHAGPCRRSVVPGVTEREDAAVGGDEPVPLAVGAGCHADDGLVEVQGARRTEVPRVTEAEDAAVGGDEPVAAAVGGGCHADDGPVEADGPGRPVERGVAEAEDAAVGGDEPVAAAVAGGCHADDGPVEADGPGRPVERGVAVIEDATVGGDEPVASAAGGRCHADDGPGQREPRLRGRPQRLGPVMGRHTARGSGRPVATARIGSHHLAPAVSGHAYRCAGASRGCEDQTRDKRTEQPEERQSSCNHEW